MTVSLVPEEGQERPFSPAGGGVSEGLWVTDAELIRRLGVPEKVAREAIRALDQNPHASGFPQKVKMWGDRRYWPAVRAYLDEAHGLTLAASTNKRGRHG